METKELNMNNKIYMLPRSYVTDDHLKLADSIKAVHADLRKKVKGGEHFDEVWRQHLDNDQVLEQYSHSMNILANQHWNKPESENTETSRIVWTRNKIQMYFNEDGLKNQLIRDRNRSKRHNVFKEDLKMEENSTRTSDDLVRIKLLDVGSCYNPFSKFSELDVTAIDIAPVYENNVCRCDFIHIQIGEKCEIEEREMKSVAAGSFDVVVFSFLLEYLPTTLPRYICCENAYRVLKENGILVILTPDSCHQQRNNHIIRGWKEALLHIGFQKVYYEKKQHFHGIVVRKLGEEQHRLAMLEADMRPQSRHEVANKFIIPQDSNLSELNDAAKKIDVVDTVLISQETVIADCSELPDFS